MAMVEDDRKKTPKNIPVRDSSDPLQLGINGTSGEAIVFSPRFKSAAAMAGWDEESLLIASLVVEDTPDRDSKYKKRSDLHFKTPPSNTSRRKRRAQRRSPISIPVGVLDLDGDEEPKKDECGKEKVKTQMIAKKKEIGEDKIMAESSGVSSCQQSSSLPRLDKLRDELSCALRTFKSQCLICLEICFEPSTTPCGHSFCKKCLRSATDKCGKRCPKCRQPMSNARSCTINTVLWNTIQLLFPQEAEARKAAIPFNNVEPVGQIPEKAFYKTRSSLPSRRESSSGVSSSREMTMRRRRVILSQEEEDAGQGAHRSFRPLRASNREMMNVRSNSSSRRIATQDKDAALALRLQREEFMEAFRVTHEHQQPSSSSLSLARANVRAMASRARATSHRLTRNV